MRSFLWVLATVAGCAIAGAIAHFPGSFPVGSGTLDAFDPSAAAFGLVMGTIFALPLGLAQWLVLRRRLGVGKRWIPATALGFGVIHALGDGLPAPYYLGPAGLADGWIVAGASGGLAVGVLQAFAAKGRVVAWTWIAGAVIAWPLGIAAGLWLAEALGLMAQSGPGAWAQQHLVVAIVAGLVVGILSSTLLPRARPLTPAGATAF